MTAQTQAQGKQLAEQGKQLAEQGKQLAEQGKQLGQLASEVKSFKGEVGRKLGAVSEWEVRRTVGGVMGPAFAQQALLRCMGSVEDLLANMLPVNDREQMQSRMLEEATKVCVKSVCMRPRPSSSGTRAWRCCHPLACISAPCE